jgi:hypothetical protein
MGDMKAHYLKKKATGKALLALGISSARLQISNQKGRDE